MSREDFQTYGFFPVYPELIIKLIEGAEQIINGTANNGKVIDMCGTPVMLYKFPYAGFCIMFQKTKS
ncbi:MAG: hypothetical protein WBI74_07325 [Caldicoprobacterales bacterium]